MSKAGVNDKLAEMGAKRLFGLTQFPVGKVWSPPRGHRWHHPRVDDPADADFEDLKRSIAAEGFHPDEPVTLWQQVAAGGEVTLDGSVLAAGEALAVLGDGSRRTRATLDVQAERRDQGTLGDGEDLMLAVKWFKGSEGDFHLMRQKADSERLKKAHRPSVVAAISLAAERAGKSVDEIVAARPRHYERETAVAILRWEDLTPPEQALFDAGVYVDGDNRQHVVDVNVLAPLLDSVPREERYGVLLQLVSANKQRLVTARRWLNNWLADRPEAAPPPQSTPRPAVRLAPAEAPPDDDSSIEEEGLDHPRYRDPPEGAEVRVDRAPPAAEPRVRPPAQAVRPSVVRRAVEAARAKKVDGPALGFFLGAEAALGDRAEAAKIVRALKGLKPEAANILAGVLWAKGHFGAAVQGAAHDTAVAIVEEAGARPHRTSPGERRSGRAWAARKAAK